MHTVRFPYEKMDKEDIPCNFCGGLDFDALCDTDRNGLPVRTVLCKRCGLIFINPRMTKKWYAKYYEEEYRAQMARFKGLDRVVSYTAEYQFEQGVKRGKELLDRALPYVKKGLTVEVGSSAGGILAAFRDRLGVPVLGIDPSPEEAAFAEKKGIHTIQTLMEDLKEKVPPAATIMVFRTLNHMLEPGKFLQWAHQTLDDGGMLILEVLNFTGAFREYGSRRQAIQIDHVYMFEPETLSAYLEWLGFDIVVSGDTDELHFYIFARKARRRQSEKFFNQKGYEQTRAAIGALPDSFFLYFFRYGGKRYFRIARLKIRRLLGLA